jgi:hypothetical protein
MNKRWSPILAYRCRTHSARDEGKRACFYEVACACERASSEVACACERASWAEPEAHEMNRCVLHDIDVAPRMQERTVGSGGGSNQNTRRRSVIHVQSLAKTNQSGSQVCDEGASWLPRSGQNKKTRYPCQGYRVRCV